MYKWRYGAIPEGCEIDHACYNRRCLEPTHLRALSHRENVIHSKTYDEKRHQRLRTFIDAYPQVTSFPVVLTLPELQVLWECKSTGNVKKLLQTMSRAFPNEFFLELFKPGQGGAPDLYAIGIQPSLIEKLSNEEALRETPTKDIVILVT
jgi:hypothetical protein